MTTAMVRQDNGSNPSEWTIDEKELIKRTVARGSTDDELKLFLYTAKRLGLDPLTKQIHFTKRRVWNPEKQGYDEVGVIQVGIDGLRAQAERSGKYAGQDPPEYQADGPMLVAATVKVYRKDFPRPIAATAYYDEYVQTIFDKKTQERKPNSQWQKMPRFQLAKCAEALALRKAFPQDLSGLYTEEEAEVIGEVVPVETPGRVEREAGAPSLAPMPMTPQMAPTMAPVPPKDNGVSKLKVTYQVQKHFTVISGNTYFLKDHSKSLGAEWDKNARVWKMPSGRAHELLALCDRLKLDYQELNERGEPIAYPPAAEPQPVFDYQPTDNDIPF